MHFIEQGGVLFELVLSDMKGEALGFEESRTDCAQIYGCFRARKSFVGSAGENKREDLWGLTMAGAATL